MRVCVSNSQPPEIPHDHITIQESVDPIRSQVQRRA
jgi:hypothetical protein